MIETQAQDKVVDALTRLGVWAFRIRAEAKLRGKPAAPPGTADIWTEYGWLELKMRRGIVSPEQTEWHRVAMRHHVNSCIVYEGAEGPKELIARSVKIVLEWRAEAMRRDHACPFDGCPLEDGHG
jgi:hypothetical protein